MKTQTSILAYDICIIGAGVAGTILAANLAKLDYRILVVDKQLSEQDRIMGELLQPGGVQSLREMGLGFLLDKIDSQKVDGYTLFLKDDYFSIPYDLDKKLAAYSFRNSKFVMQARAYIAGLPNVDLVEGNVKKLLEENNTIQGISYSVPSSKKNIEVRAKLTFVCEGQVSKLRDKTAKSYKKVKSYFVGLVLQNCELPVPHNGHVILTGEAPILVYPISSSETRILIDFPGSVPPKMNEEMVHYLQTKIRNHLPTQLHTSFDRAVMEKKFKGMPNHNLKAMPNKRKKNVVLLGDSFNMRHPITGGGMSAVFNDIKNLFKVIIKYRNLNSSTNINRVVTSYYKNRSKDVANINILADSLYHATITPSLKQASFNYLKNEPNHLKTIKIIAGLDKKKYNLIRHFIEVVVEGINKLNLTPTKKIKLVSKSAKILLPLVMQEGNTRLHRWGTSLYNRFFVSMSSRVYEKNKTKHTE